MSVVEITKKMYQCACERTECAYKWETAAVPTRCPKCKSRRWNRAARLSSKKPITYNGETLSIAEWSKRLGLAKTTIPWRIKQGFPMDQVLSSEDWRKQQ